MQRKRLAPLLGRLALLAAVTMALTGAGAGAVEVSADSNKANIKNVVQAKLAQAGIATSSTGGVAAAGPPVAINIVAVPQINAQVVVGGPQTQALSTQNATNTLNANQGTTALTGDASGTGGGTATSGAAVAGSIIVGAQVNVQVIACMNATAPIDQTASNEATIDQLTGAASGDASATGAGSDASTGSALALNVMVIRQRNVQVYRCGSPTSGGGSTQTAANQAGVAQTAMGVSGNADAAGGGSANSGRVRSIGFGKVRQSNTQIGSD